MLAWLSVVLALSGIGIGIALFGKTPLRKMPKILEEKWRIDELYNGYIVDPITKLSREGLWKGFDLGFIDGIVNGIGHFVIEVGQSGPAGAGRICPQLRGDHPARRAGGVGYFIYYGLSWLDSG